VTAVIVTVVVGTLAVVSRVLSGIRDMSRLHALREALEAPAPLELPEADPLLEEFAKLEATVARRSCTHRNVTCMETVGSRYRQHICDDCGELTTTHLPFTID